MRSITDLPAWDRLFKRIVWEQIGNLHGKYILDFGSGEGITADHFAKDNTVVAVEPWDKMIENAWKDNNYRQIIGDVGALSEFPDDTFDVVICHNVLEYIDDKKQIIKELARVLKPDGFISIAKHNRNGRIMQMAVLLDDKKAAAVLLDGENSASSIFGAIRYYDDSDISRWVPELYIDRCFGIRTFWDLQQNQERHPDEDWQQEMMKLEMCVSEIEAFRNIAFFHHLIIKKHRKDI